MRRIKGLVLALTASFSLSACGTVPSGDMAPAALLSADETTVSAVETAAGKVLRRETVKLGSSDFMNSPAVSVLPERSVSPAGAPFNQNDFAIPTLLLLMTDGSNCFLVKEDTRDWAHVAGVDCRALNGPPAP